MARLRRLSFPRTGSKSITTPVDPPGLCHVVPGRKEEVPSVADGPLRSVVIYDRTDVQASEVSRPAAVG